MDQSDNIMCWSTYRKFEIIDDLQKFWSSVCMTPQITWEQATAVVCYGNNKYEPWVINVSDIYLTSPIGGSETQLTIQGPGDETPTHLCYLRRT